MRTKFRFLFGVLMALPLLAGCNDETNQEQTNIHRSVDYDVEINLEKLEEVYGPALTKSISNLSGVNSFAYPVGVQEISLMPSGNDIPSLGETRLVTIVGSFDKIMYRAYEPATNTTLIEIEISNTYGNLGMGELVLPAFEVTEDKEDAVRVILFQYFNPQTGNWDLHQYGVQTAIVKKPFSAWLDADTYLYRSGGMYIIGISGEFPQENSEMVLFRAFDVTNHELISTAYIIGTTIKSVIIPITPITDYENREIVFEYALSTDLNTWIEFDKYTQRYRDQIDFFIEHNIPDVIPAEGGEYFIKTTENWDALNYAMTLIHPCLEKPYGYFNIIGKSAMFRKLQYQNIITFDSNETGKERDVTILSLSLPWSAPYDDEIYDENEDQRPLYKLVKDCIQLAD